MALTPQDSIIRHSWVCQRCQYRNSVESRFCHSPSCLASMVPATPPMRGLLAMQLYADDVALLLDRYDAPRGRRRQPGSQNRRRNSLLDSLPNRKQNPRGRGGTLLPVLARRATGCRRRARD